MGIHRGKKMTGIRSNNPGQNLIREKLVRVMKIYDTTKARSSIF